MIRWKAFNHNGNVYDLSHLHPVTVQYEQPSKGNNPVRVFTVDVCFGLHCFTEGYSEITDSHPLSYGDSRETRLFDFNRYELSKKLPEIIKELNKRSCMHTGHGNFFIIEIVNSEGEKAEYEVYFDVKKVNSDKAHLFVNSAFAADGRRKRKQSKKISLYIILHNKLAGIPIRAPR